MPISISVHRLQAEASRMVKKAEGGAVVQIMRYSKPVAVMLSIDEYHDLHQDCHNCVRHWRKVTGKKLRKAES